MAMTPATNTTTEAAAGALSHPRSDPSIHSSDWAACRFLTCSVLPVRMACNLACPFCFSKSSISSLKSDKADWSRLDVERYYEFAAHRGATRLVITGGGEPLLDAESTLSLIERAQTWFREIALFTNGTCLSRRLAERLAEAGLSYICYSRHHDDDESCRRLMGGSAPRLGDFLTAAGPLKIRATCVMTRGYIDSTAAVDRYIARLGDLGVREFTFKHTYVAYDYSVFANSPHDEWARRHQVQRDPFVGCGQVIAELPWGPQIRQVGEYQVCYYFEPNPLWEQEHQLCRSSNLLSDGCVYASLEDRRSLLFRLSG